MRKLPLIFIITGVIIFLTPIAGQVYTSYSESLLIHEWEAGQMKSSQTVADARQEYVQLQNVLGSEFQDDSRKAVADKAVPDSKAKIDAAEKAQQEIKPAADTGKSVKPAAKSKKPGTPQKVLGIMKIEKIKVNVPVVEGVKAENLRVGVGHMPGTAGIGDKGNTVIAGHRSYTFGRFFNRLDELEAGDEIIITTKKGVYKYKVYEKLIVDPKDMSVLAGSDKDSMLTLITCHPIYIASQRLIIRAAAE